jgi:hypothetical protein
MQESREALNHISKSEFSELKSLQSPPKPVERVFSAMSLALGYKPDWQSIQTLLSDSQLLQKIISLHPSDIPLDTLEKIKNTVDNFNLSEDTLMNSSMAAYHLFRWLHNLYHVAIDKLPEGDKPDNKHLVSTSETKLPEDYHADHEQKDVRREELAAHYEAAQDAVKMVESECILTEGKGFLHPTERVEKVIKIMCMLLSEEATWENGKKIVQDCELLSSKMKEAKIEEIPAETIEKVRCMLLDPEIRHNVIHNDCPGACSILLWITTVVNYWVLDHYIETGESAFSESAEKECKKVESQIIRSHSRLLDDEEVVTEDDMKRIAQFEKRCSIENLENFNYDS